MPERDIVIGQAQKIERPIKLRAGGLPKRTHDDLNQNAIDYVNIAKKVSQEVELAYRRDKLIEQHQLDPEDPQTQEVLGEIENISKNATIHQFIPIIAEKRIKKFKEEYK